MNMRILLAASAGLFLSLAALAADPSTPPPAEEPPPASNQVSSTQASPDPYAHLNKKVQEKLHAMGYYNGPINGDFGFNTQAALAKFQLSWPLPVSGMLDDTTLAALGIEPEAQATAGASAGASAAGMPAQTADGGGGANTQAGVK